MPHEVLAVLHGVVFKHVVAAVSAVFIYDTLLTMDGELQFIWRKKIRIGAILYVFSRYGGLLSTPVGIALFLNLDLWICAGTYPILALCGSVLSAVGTRGIMWGRVYAITNGCRWLMSVPLLFLVAYITLMVLKIQSCHFSPRLKHTKHTIGIVTYVLIVFLDSLNFLLTIWYTWATYKIQSQVMAKTTLTELLLKQGIVHFGIIVLYGAIEIVEQIKRPSVTGMIFSLHNILSSLLMCRFHIALAQRNAHSELGSYNPGDSSTIIFNTISRRIGESIVSEFGDRDILVSSPIIQEPPRPMGR